MEIGVNHSSGNLSIDMTHENIFEKLRTNRPWRLGLWTHSMVVQWYYTHTFRGAQLVDKSTIQIYQ